MNAITFGRRFHEDPIIIRWTLPTCLTELTDCAINAISVIRINPFEWPAKRRGPHLGTDHQGHEFPTF